MSVLKRNIGLVIFCACALIVAVVLAVFLQKYAARAADFEAKVTEQRNFFRELKQRPVQVNQVNLEAITDNYELTSQQLQQLRSTLRSRSRILVEPVTPVQAKNILTRATREMENDLESEGIIVEDAARSFGFQSILAADSLPGEEEVPVIMKQLELVREIVRLTGKSYVDRVISIERPLGLKTEDREFFSFTPFRITFQGKVSAVKELITKLQSDAQYLLAVQYFTVNSSNEAESLLTTGPGAEYRRLQELEEERASRERSASGRPESRTRRRMPPPRDDGEGEVEAEPLPKEARQIDLQDVVTIAIRVDFLEFKEPEQE